MSDEGEQARVRERLHILDGILDALDRMDDINNVVRVSSDRIAARKVLQSEPFNYSETVSRHILDLSVGRQTIAGVEELRLERRKAIAALNEGE